MPSSAEAIEACPRLTPASSETTLAKTEKTREGEGEGYSGGEDSDSNHNESPGVKIPIERRPYYESTEKYRKTLRLSSEQIVSNFTNTHVSHAIVQNINKNLMSLLCDFFNKGESRSEGRR